MCAGRRGQSDGSEIPSRRCSASGLMTKKGSSLKERSPGPIASGSEAPTAKPVHLRLLNSFSISSSAGEPVVVRGSRAQCILAFLALQPQYSCTRQR